VEREERNVICQECGYEGEAVNHNNRGLRCPSCWAEVEERDTTATELVDFVSEAQAMALAGLGIRTLTDAVEADVETLMSVDGIGPKTSERLKERAEG
jgi:predicted RecB family nuclease